MARRRETLDDLLGDVTSYAKLAETVGIARRTLYGARKGRMPRRLTIAKLAGVLGVDTARLRAAIAASRAGK